MHPVVIIIYLIVNTCMYVGGHNLEWVGILAQKFGFTSFRDGQVEVIQVREHVLNIVFLSVTLNDYIINVVHNVYRHWSRAAMLSLSNQLAQGRAYASNSLHLYWRS